MKAALKVLATTMLSVMTAACSSGNASGNEGVTTSVSSSSAAESTDPLIGRWDTGPFPCEHIRAAVIAGGFTRVDAESIYQGDQAHCEYQFRFADGRWVAVGWDPDAGPPTEAGESGTYELQGDEQVLLTNDVGAEYLVSYQIEAGQLTLDVLRVTTNSTPEDQYITSYYTEAYTSAPYVKSN